MALIAPTRELSTHSVFNQPPPLEGVNLFATDAVLRAGIERAGATWANKRLSAFGAKMGEAGTWRAAELANRNLPLLRPFDRYGRRLDEVEYHPAYHELMSLGLEAGIHNLPWSGTQPGRHTVHAALEYLLVQVEAGVCCPITMTYAAIPALQPHGAAGPYLPGLLATGYDPAIAPPAAKRALTCGMAMTEKQGGSDVRANTTRAVRSGEGHWRLTGHKWFCSAPMSDLFLTLAQTAGGLSCFLVPRWLPDGTRNPFYVQRLKDKLGNRSNASAELEYRDTQAWLLGEEGRGVRTIIEMVHHTRLDTCLAAAGLMRQAFVQAVHHACYREAFGKRLIDQPLMQNVLADLALESEAALLLTLRIAAAYDAVDAPGAGASDSDAASLARLLVAIGKYWVNRRTPAVVFEALECLGGAGYVEESPLPRLYREAPLNSIWEGSGNVICLDVLRTLSRSPRAADLLFDQLQPTAAAEPRVASAIAEVQRLLSRTDALETNARRITGLLATALQAGLMMAHSEPQAAGAFLQSRLGSDGERTYGTLAADVDRLAILHRAWPPLTAR